MTAEKWTELESTLASRISRRSALRWAVRGAFALASVAAGLGLPKAAYACTTYACCCLEYYPPHWCPSGISCPCNDQDAYLWYCNTYGPTWACGECPNCHPACSFAYCVSGGCPNTPGATPFNSSSAQVPQPKASHP